MARLDFAAILGPIKLWRINMSRSFVGEPAPRPRCRRPPTLVGYTLALVFLLNFAAAKATMADSDIPVASLTEASASLTMMEAARLAAVDQPLLTGRQAKIEAEDQQAIAAAQLPDPQVAGGLKELPIDTPEAFSTRRDNFTEFTIGLSQEFPRA
jgi:hypothetical protein